MAKKYKNLIRVKYVYNLYNLCASHVKINIKYLDKLII